MRIRQWKKTIGLIALSTVAPITVISVTACSQINSNQRTQIKENNQEPSIAKNITSANENTISKIQNTIKAPAASISSTNTNVSNGGSSYDGFLVENNSVTTFPTVDLSQLPTDNLIFNQNSVQYSSAPFFKIEKNEYVLTKYQVTPISLMTNMNNDELSNSTVTWYYSTSQTYDVNSLNQLNKTGQVLNLTENDFASLNLSQSYIYLYAKYSFGGRTFFTEPTKLDLLSGDQPVMIFNDYQQTSISPQVYTDNYDVNENGAYFSVYIPKNIKYRAVSWQIYTGPENGWQNIVNAVGNTYKLSNQVSNLEYRAVVQLEGVENVDGSPVVITTNPITVNSSGSFVNVLTTSDKTIIGNNITLNNSNDTVQLNANIFNATSGILDYKIQWYLGVNKPSENVSPDEHNTSFEYKPIENATTPTLELHGDWQTLYHYNVYAKVTNVLTNQVYNTKPVSISVPPILQKVSISVGDQNPQTVNYVNPNETYTITNNIVSNLQIPDSAYNWQRFDGNQWVNTNLDSKTLSVNLKPGDREIYRLNINFPNQESLPNLVSNNLIIESQLSDAEYKAAQDQFAEFLKNKDALQKVYAEWAENNTSFFVDYANYAQLVNNKTGPLPSLSDWKFTLDDNLFLTATAVTTSEGAIQNRWNGQTQQIPIGSVFRVVLPFTFKNVPDNYSQTSSVDKAGITTIKLSNAFPNWEWAPWYKWNEFPAGWAFFKAGTTQFTQENIIDLGNLYAEKIDSLGVWPAGRYVIPDNSTGLVFSSLVEKSMPSYAPAGTTLSQPNLKIIFTSTSDVKTSHAYGANTSVWVNPIVTDGENVNFKYTWYKLSNLKQGVTPSDSNPLTINDFNNADIISGQTGSRYNFSLPSIQNQNITYYYVCQISAVLANGISVSTYSPVFSVESVGIL